MLLDRNTRSVNVTNVINDNIKLNLIIISSRLKFQPKLKFKMDDILQNKIKPPTPPPLYRPPPLLTTNEIKRKEKEYMLIFIKHRCY